MKTIKRMFPRGFLLLTLAFAVAAGTAFGQGLLPKKIWTLTISVNVPNATIYVDNVKLQGNVAKVAGGAHNLKVQATGYFDFNGPVTVDKDMTYTVQLKPQSFPLTISVNVPNVTVLIDGNDFTGTVPNLSVGSHTIQVSARGYRDYNYVVELTAAMSLNVTLEPIGFMMTVNANVKDATVIVNNEAKGPVPYQEYLEPGTYTVRVSAAGYADYIASVSLTKAVTLNVQLQPQAQPSRQTSTLTFMIPPAFADPDVRPNDPQGQVKIFVDNKLVNPKRELTGIPIAPGRHRIRIGSGAFSMQLGDITVQPGVSYVIEISIDMKVRAVRPND